MKKSLFFAFSALGAMVYVAHATGLWSKLAQGWGKAPGSRGRDEGVPQQQPHRRAKRRARPNHRTADGMLDLNSASQEELQKLQGMDAVMAESIIENRPYLSKIDLVGRMVIPDAAYESIKHDITVRNAA